VPQIEKDEYRSIGAGYTVSSYVVLYLTVSSYVVLYLVWFHRIMINIEIFEARTKFFHLGMKTQ
jgi:hypothetical protein